MAASKPELDYYHRVIEALKSEHKMVNENANPPAMLGKIE